MNAVPELSFDPEGQHLAEKTVLKGDDKGEVEETKVVVEEVEEPEEEFTEEEFKKLKRKIDWTILPLLWICYGIQQTDKTSISTQALYGLREDTGLKGNQYAMLTTMFYIFYMLSEAPSTYALQRLNLGKGLSVYMICWGCMVIAVGLARNYTQLVTFRSLQGVFESTISPGFLFLIGGWYKTEEHASRSMFFQSANAGFGIIADLVMVLGIARAAEKHEGGFAAWRGIGMFLGGLTLLSAFACMIMLGTPSEVWWLSKRERAMANARIASNNSGTDVTGRKKWSWPQVRDALADPQTWFCAANTFLSCIPNGGLTTFGSLINKAFGFTNEEVILYGIPRSVLSVSLFALIMYSTRRWTGIRFWIMMAACVPPFVGLLSIALLPTDVSYKWTKWGMYLIAVTFIIPTFMGWQMIPSNMAGKTKRTVCSSINFIAYCVGNIIGSQVFRPDDAPRYLRGTAVIAACIGVQFCVILAWRTYYVWRNKQQTRFVEELELSPVQVGAKAKELGNMDKTDRENPYFRYSL